MRRVSFDSTLGSSRVKDRLGVHADSFSEDKRQNSEGAYPELQTKEGFGLT